MLTLEKMRLSHTPNYVVLTAPGEMLEEKIIEMETSIAEFAQTCGIPLKTLQGIIKAEIPLTPTIANKLENATKIPTTYWLRYEKNYRKNLEFVKEHPDYPVIRHRYFSCNENQERLQKSIASYEAGKVVIKTTKELEMMEKE
jgi:plasmid maintenance system antidote protein VapI